MRENRWVITDLTGKGGRMLAITGRLIGARLSSISIGAIERSSCVRASGGRVILIGICGVPDVLYTDNVLTQEEKAGEKRGSLASPHGMWLRTTVPPSGFHVQGLSVRP